MLANNILDQPFLITEPRIKTGFLKELKGKLYHPSVGGGTIYTVSTEKVKLIKANGNIREYQIEAPGLEANDWREGKVFFQYDEKYGWKIDSSPEILGF